jgi:hypothetical protein
MFCQVRRLAYLLTGMVAPPGKTEIKSNFLWDKGLNVLAKPTIFNRIHSSSQNRAHAPQPGKRRNMPQPDPHQYGTGRCGL